MKHTLITKAVKIKSQRVKPFDGEIKYLPTGGLVENKIKTENVTYNTKPTRADLLVATNQLIVARMKETNKVLLIDQNTNDLIVSTGFLVLDVQEGWHPKFLFHYFKSNYFQNQKDKLSIGATQKAINNENFNEILIPEVPYEEQKRIIKNLDRSELLDQKRKQSITLLDQYLYSVFFEMFGDPNFNDKKWPLDSLKNITEVFSDGPFGSNLKTEHYRDYGIRVIRLGNIGINEFLDDKKLFISEEHYQTIKKHTCLPGDILIATLGDPNIRACMLPAHITLAVNKADCLLCRPKLSRVSPQYLCYLLNTPSFLLYVSNLIHGQTRSRISSGQLKKIDIQVPPLELQEKFSEIVHKIELLKQKMLKQSKELDIQFQSLMQSSFN